MTDTLMPQGELDPALWKLVQAFRQAGAVPYQQMPVKVAREAYRKSCARNGFAFQPVAIVQDFAVPTSGGHVVARLYRAQGTQINDPLPCLLFFHGGGWVIGDLDTHDGICRYLANASGGSVLAVDYRRSPEHRYPVPLGDCISALSYLDENAHALHIDATRIAVGGDSAGGNLAAVVALMARDGRTVPLSGQVLLYPVTDLAQRASSYDRVTSDIPFTAASMSWFRSHYLNEESDGWDWTASPLRAETLAEVAPAYVVTVEHDPLADEGIAYAERLVASGVPVIHQHLPRYTHGIFNSVGAVPSAVPILSDVARFLTQSWK